MPALFKSTVLLGTFLACLQALPAQGQDDLQISHKTIATRDSSLWLRLQVATQPATEDATERRVIFLEWIREKSPKGRPAELGDGEHHLRFYGYDSSRAGIYIQGSNVLGIYEKLSVNGQMRKVFTYTDQFVVLQQGLSPITYCKNRRLRYPSEARETGIQGVVDLGLIIDPQGRMVDFEPRNAPTPSLADAAANAIDGCPVRWNPAMFKGEEVYAMYMLPIRFSLQR